LEVSSNVEENDIETDHVGEREDMRSLLDTYVTIAKQLEIKF
jgi:hypothetical protein